MHHARTPRSRSRAGFTLLEAILALGILAAATIAALEIRVQMLRSGEKIRHAQREDRDHEALFEMLVSGMLEEPVKTEERGPVWTGMFLDEPYRITRSVTLVNNPAVGAVAYEVAPRIPVFEFRIEYAGRTTQAIWHEAIR